MQNASMSMTSNQDEAGRWLEHDEKSCQTSSSSASLLEAASTSYVFLPFHLHTSSLLSRSKFKPQNPFPTLCMETITCTSRTNTIYKSSLSITTKDPSAPNTNPTSDDQVIHEAWVLNRTYPLRRKIITFGILSIPCCYFYEREKVDWWSTALPTCATDITTYLQTSTTQNISLNGIHSKIRAMPQDAQWEIQNLLEDREKSCSHRHVNRKWEIVGLVERPSRYVEGPVTEKRWLGMRSKKVVPLEWVAVIKGETVDHQERIKPSRFADSWEQRKERSTAPKDLSDVCLQNCWHCADTGV